MLRNEMRSMFWIMHLFQELMASCLGQRLQEERSELQQAKNLMNKGIFINKELLHGTEL